MLSLGRVQDPKLFVVSELASLARLNTFLPALARPDNAQVVVVVCGAGLVTKALLARLGLACEQAPQALAFTSNPHGASEPR